MIVYVVASTGARNVLAAIVGAAPWMPAIVTLDACYFLGESFAHRALMGPKAREIPTAVFVRTLLSSYALSVLAPLGRAGVEVTRVAAYGAWVGTGRATAASVSAQAVSVLANAGLCAAAAVATGQALGLRHPLTLALVGLTVAMAAFSLAVALLMRRSRVGRWIGARIPRLRAAGEDLDQALRESPGTLLRAVGWATASRASQVVQAALLIAAVHGAVSPRSALISQGIHIVGSTLGEAIPAQTGAIEASYRIFAAGLGFAATPARAVAVALLGRVSQLLVATTSLALLATVPALGARRPRWGTASTVALVVATALAVNLPKAVHIDDAAHFAIARWIQQHPAHPMSGVVFWGEHPAPIASLNQPPGLFFLMAGVMSLAGNDTVFPQHLMIAGFVVVGVLAYLALARRTLSAGWTTLTTLALFLGPAFLPSQNVMTDVPLLALWLVFFALLAGASNRPWRHAFAALVATLACFVKYTSLVLLVVLALDLALHHRRRLWVLLVPVAALVAWSIWNLADYGGIHVLSRSVAVARAPSWAAAVGIVFGRAGLWVITLGAVAPFVLAFAPRRVPWWVVGVLAAGTAVGQVLARCFPAELGGETVLQSFLRAAFLVLGAGAVALAVRAARERWRERTTQLLATWIACTAAFIVVLSPFVSVRHVLLVLPALLLLLAGGQPDPTPRAYAVVGASVVLGVAVAVADARYANTYRDFAVGLGGNPAGATWTVGHWGWQYYAEHAGLHEYDPGVSVLRPGDRLIRPRIVDQQSIAPADQARLSLVEERVVPASGWLGGLRTVTSRQGFYAVWGGLPWTFTDAPLEVFEIWTVASTAPEVSGGPR